MFYLSPYALVIKNNSTITFFSHGAPIASVEGSNSKYNSLLTSLMNHVALSRDELDLIFSSAVTDQMIADGILAEEIFDISSIYSRTDAFFREYRLTNARQQLRNDKVLILGCGGIGTQLAWHMVALGIEELTLVDFDSVEESNLNRQTVFDTNDIGKLKTEVLKNKLHRINPDVKIRCVCEKIDSFESLSSICKSDTFDLIIKSLDSPSQLPAWLDCICREIKVPYIAGITLQNKVLIGPTFIPGQSEIGWSDLIPMHSEAEKIHGVSPSFGPMLYRISAELATEAFKVLTGYGKLKYQGKIVSEDILTNTNETITKDISAQTTASPVSPPEPSRSRILLSMLTVVIISAFAHPAVSFISALLLPYLCSEDKSSIIKQSFLTGSVFSVASFIRWFILNHSYEGFSSALDFISNLTIVVCLLCLSLLLICLINAAVFSIFEKHKNRKQEIR